MVADCLRKSRVFVSIPISAIGCTTQCATRNNFITAARPYPCVPGGNRVRSSSWSVRRRTFHDHHDPGPARACTRAGALRSFVTALRCRRRRHPANIGSLQAVLDAAQSGDTIQFADGIYPLSQTLVAAYAWVLCARNRGAGTWSCSDGGYISRRSAADPAVEHNGRRSDGRRALTGTWSTSCSVAARCHARCFPTSAPSTEASKSSR